MKIYISLFLISLINLTALAQPFDPSYASALKWRMIGPYRGGRTVGAVGVPQQPNVFYIGVNNGGVWKTTDYGRTWKPIFDDQPTGSIGDVVVAPSNPNVLYVASGEGLQRPDLSVGDGMYKSADGGKTWSHQGLKDGQQIGGLAIDPKNENRVFAAVLGHPYGPNKERGIYRTTDGGKNWNNVLYIDENTGAIQVFIDPTNTNVVYATMWAGRQGPWENGAWNGANSGLYKSTDGGNTWRKLTKGLPTTQEGLGRIGFGVAPSDPTRLYATVDADEKGGIYRSDDAGESWMLMDADPRLWGRGSDFAEVKVDPNNKDIVYSANVVTWKSTDGGKSWKAFRGAPGGDDYHRIWINPINPSIILIASDQGAHITVNGGETFSSWYNQPTAQFYHVSTDNSFPYNVYGGQQESGSVGIASRGNDGQITYRDWHPVGVEEYGYVAVDPLDQNIIYGGKITKYDKRTGQVQNIAPEAVRTGKYRFLRTAPVLFSPVDPKTLYYAGNVLFKTQNGGQSWKVISPDLSRESWEIPASVGIYTEEKMKTMPRRGVIYTIAPSFKNVNTIWCGTDDGLIHLTNDGGMHWKNVTPSVITSWSKISLMEASHFDVQTAYAAVNCIRLDDMKPHIYKTNDGGKTWKEIVNGLPNDPINVVREDPYRKGMLYAGSERAVYVSLDEGEHWQSLRLNMPATSIRDLVIKENDLVVGTHGRSFWILDNIAPLRELNTIVYNNPITLHRPASAWRVRWSMYTDTPVPQEEAAGENPPDGAIIDYYINQNITDDITLEISDAKGNLVRKFSSADKPYIKPQDNIPDYWVRPQEMLSKTKGAHRFIWDLHYTPVDVTPTYPMGAVYQKTAPNTNSPWVMPGTYTVKLLVNGQTLSQQLIVKMDPRVKTSVIDLQLQFDWTKKLYDLRNKVRSITTKDASLNKEKSNIDSQLASIIDLLQDADNKPTTQALDAATVLIANANKWISVAGK
ncbi:MAG: hypothetical protein K9I82_14680 [Chitinophagaceae bacterium]|nr:hypothetical protein [Chitinophagaceae bacterium]